MNRQELLEALTQDILAYAMHGAFPQREIARAIKPEGLDERFEEYELLLDLHFVLTDQVVEFVRELPERLRSIRTETESIARTQRGTVDGHIDWGATIKKRYTRNPRNSALFVCTNRTEDYDIAENLVLKRLLSVIYSTLREAEEYLRGDYEWVQQTWKGNEALIDELNQIVERNVHVRRIRAPAAYEPTERMMTAAESSRQAVYRDAADCLRTRERLFRGDAEEIRRLLDSTSITPDDNHTLFELYVLFRFVSTIEELQSSPPTYKTIASERQALARFQGEKEIILYHDNSARDRGLSFVTEEEPPDRPLTRAEKVQNVARSVANRYFTDRKDFRDHTGRPDVIVLEVISEESDEHEYLIAEVKHSTNVDTIRQGIKETLEYLAFLRVNEEFVFGSKDSEDYFGSGWNGMLVIQDLDGKSASLTEQTDSEIKIVQASELETFLDSVLRRVI